MNDCNAIGSAMETRLLIGALVVLCNTIATLAVILTRKNGGKRVPDRDDD